MNRIAHWIVIINKNRSRSFWVALALLIITLLGMRISSACMQLPQTPLAIFDLEMAFDQARANDIKELWTTYQCQDALSISSNALEVAVVNTILDFAFILAYTWFFIVLLVLTQFNVKNPFDKLTIVGCYAAIMAGSMDVIENIAMIIFLTIEEINSLLFAIPATIKFAIIVALIIWILLRLSSMVYSKMTA